MSLHLDYRTPPNPKPKRPLGERVGEMLIWLYVVAAVVILLEVVLLVWAVSIAG